MEMLNGSLDMSIENDICYLFGDEEEVHQDSVMHDHLGSLVCGEDELYSVSQAVDYVGQPSPRSASPPRSAEVELTLQPSLLKSWS